MKQQLYKLYQSLGYTFRDEALIHQALTHRSVSQKNNERLEFLGDALLGMLIAEALYQRFPQVSEGEMSRVRSNLVQGLTLSEIARDLRLGDYLHLGVGELKSGGFDRDSILADALEAVMGAMYLDSDFNTCKQVVIAWYETRLQAPDLFKKIKDPKTLLQEHLQAQKMPLPQYTVLSIEGEAHDLTFLVKCTVSGLPFEVERSASTRRGAEQKTAEAFLAWLEQDHV